MQNTAGKAWYKLDNAAKIFPPTSNRSETRVFRFSCELREMVKAELLQKALDETLKKMKSFQYVLKRGIFWYYLEQSDLQARVSQERASVCSTIYLDRKALLFDVTYYKKRINLEVYHVLTDGVGAMGFLKALVINYLKLAHPQALKKVAVTEMEASETQKMADSFNQYYNQDKKALQKRRMIAYQLTGAKKAEQHLQVIEGNMSLKDVLAVSRKRKVSATMLVVAVLMMAIAEEMKVRDKKKPVVISVPVNLRNYFKSKTARNFFSLIYVAHNFSQQGETLEEVMASVREGFGEQLNEKYLQARLNELFGLEDNFLIRRIPLPIKNMGLSLAYAILAREFTGSVTNVGKIEMPVAARAYMSAFSVLSSTEKLVVGICSYGDNLNLSMTAPFINTDIQRNFLRRLKEMGIEVKRGGEYPEVALTKHEYSLLWRWLQWGSAVGVISAVAINVMLPESGWWSAWVVAGVACAWMLIVVAIEKRRHILKNLTYQVTLVSGLSLVWDVCTGWHGWSIDFVIPIAFMTAEVATAVLAKVLKMPTETYIIYSVLLIIYGIIPAGLVAGGVSKIVMPSLLCAASSLLLLATLLIFEGKNMGEELGRRGHV